MSFRNNPFEDTEKKGLRYRLHKSGKNWVTTMVFGVSMGLGLTVAAGQLNVGVTSTSARTVLAAEVDEADPAATTETPATTAAVSDSDQAKLDADKDITAVRRLNVILLERVQNTRKPIKKHSQLV